MQKEQSTYVIAGSIIAAGLIVAVGIIASSGNSGEIPEQNAGEAVAVSSVSVNPVSPDDHIRGSDEADLTIIEFSDPECPFCKRFHGTMNAIMAQYGEEERVAWVYRHFPIPQLHRKAETEAHAFECAAGLGGNDGFWKYADALFEETPSNDGLDLSRLPEIAEEIGLNKSAFETCQESGKYFEKIERDVEDAIASAGRGTPHNVFVVKSGVAFSLPGAMPEVMVREVIDTTLASIDAGDSERTLRQKVGAVVAKYR